MARGDAFTSPWIYTETGIVVQVHFNNSTFALANPAITGTREATCPWSRVQVGSQSVGIPTGDFSVSRQSMNSLGFSTVQNVMDSGFTLTN